MLSIRENPEYNNSNGLLSNLRKLIRKKMGEISSLLMVLSHSRMEPRISDI